MPTSSDTLSRTTPATSSGAADAARTNASDACDIARADPASARATSVGTSPLGERMNSTVRSACSSASMRARTVGCATPRRRAAADRLPSSSTARKAR